MPALGYLEFQLEYFLVGQDSPSPPSCSMRLWQEIIIVPLFVPHLVCVAHLARPHQREAAARLSPCDNMREGLIITSRMQLQHRP